MNIENLFQVFILVTGLVGQILIAHRRKEAFVVWIFSNVALILVSVTNELWGMVTLYMFFSFMCIYSYIKWNQLEKAIF